MPTVRTVRLARLDADRSRWTTLPDSEIIGWGPVTAGSRVVWPSTGSADGGDCDGDDASDGAVNPEDRIRVQIWDIRTGVFVYDTDMGDEDDAAPTTELDGGSVHVWA